MAAASCAHEVAVAATWFAEQLFEPNDQRSIFCDRLQELLIARYQGHWYPDEPHRGCAFRSLLSTVNAMDPLLLRAADATGHRGVQESFMRCFSDAGEVTCWINPGEVKVLRGRAQHTLYSDGTGSDNPYDEKLKIKIEPTRLAVKVDPVQHIPQSPVSSHGAQSLHGADAFGAFRHASGLSAAMGSQSQSPTESPMPSWRASTVAPPAITPLPPHMGANGGYGGFNQGFGADQGYCGFDGGMGSMGLGGFGSNGLAPQGQQGGGVPHSSPMRGYGSYAPQSSYGHTPQQPVF